MELADYRKLLKKHHICRDCKKQDAYTLAGRTYCAECAQKQAEAKRNEYARDGGKKIGLPVKNGNKKMKRNINVFIAASSYPMIVNIKRVITAVLK